MLRQFLIYLTSLSLVIGTIPAVTIAQPAAPAAAGAAGQPGDVEKFSAAQLDALLAPIALYPDGLLTQVLMAATNPLDIVAASRWLAQGNNKDLKGQALEEALRRESWDPSVKSLVPFPQVLEMLNRQLEFTQQLGYAMQVQEPDVFAAIQRLRGQAQAAGNLMSTPQQIVRTEPVPAPPPGAAVDAGAPTQAIVIEPAQPDVVYVPAYDPNQVFGAWTYPDIPPVYFAPPPGYGYGSLIGAGLLFGAGVAVVAGLWGWARPNWGWRGYRGGYGFGNVNVDVNRWNNLNVNRPWNGGPNGDWRPNNPIARPGGGINRPAGPVGRPGTPGGLPPGIGSGNRPNLPPGIGPGNRPGLPPGAGPGNRPNPPPGVGSGSRPGVPGFPGGGQGIRPGNPPGNGQGNRPATRPGNRAGGGEVNRSVTRPAVPVDRPATRPSPRPVQRPAQRPQVQRPAQRPQVQRPAQLPAQRPQIQGPAQRPNFAQAVARPGGAGGRPAVAARAGGGGGRPGGGGHRR